MVLKLFTHFFKISFWLGTSGQCFWPGVMGKWIVCVFWGPPPPPHNASHIFGLVLIHDMGMNLLSGCRNESRPRFILLIMSLYISPFLSLTFYVIKYVVYVCKSQHSGLHKIFQVKDWQRSRNTEITLTIRIVIVGKDSIKQLGKNIWLSLFALIRSGPKSGNPISVYILLMVSSI